jgi:hypothetical protein
MERGNSVARLKWRTRAHERPKLRTAGACRDLNLSKWRQFITPLAGPRPRPCSPLMYRRPN